MLLDIRYQGQTLILTIIYILNINHHTQIASLINVKIYKQKSSLLLFDKIFSYCNHMMKFDILLKVYIYTQL